MFNPISSFGKLRAFTHLVFLYYFFSLTNLLKWHKAGLLVHIAMMWQYHFVNEDNDFRNPVSMLGEGWICLLFSPLLSLAHPRAPFQISWLETGHCCSYTEIWQVLTSSWAKLYAYFMLVLKFYKNNNFVVLLYVILLRGSSQSFWC